MTFILGMAAGVATTIALIFVLAIIGATIDKDTEPYREGERS
jgi:hypothetical protein